MLFFVCINLVWHRRKGILIFHDISFTFRDSVGLEPKVKLILSSRHMSFVTFLWKIHIIKDCIIHSTSSCNIWLWTLWRVIFHWLLDFLNVIKYVCFKYKTLSDTFQILKILCGRIKVWQYGLVALNTTN